MNNEQFFKAVNEDAGFEYVKDPDSKRLVKTRDTIADFKTGALINGLEFDSEVETSFGTIYKLLVNSHELLVMDDGEFRYCWKD